MKKPDIIYSPAKVNLYLDILKKRDDGFHEIESVFSEVSLYDEISIQPSNKFKIEIDEDSASFALKINLLKNNLLEQIFFYFKKNYFIEDLEIKLKKIIPIGAGLGGGSSNAGYFIKYLNKKFSLNLNQEKLKEIGSLFGSDIPFFIDGGAAIVKGRGEIVEKIEIVNDLCKMMIVYPNIHISTKDAYKKFVSFGQGKNFEEVLLFFKKKTMSNNLKKMSLLFYNAFETKLLSCYKSMNDVVDRVKERNGFAMVSGSGSAMIVFFKDNEDELRRVLSRHSLYIYNVELLK